VHGVGFSRRGLSVGEDGAVDPFRHGLDNVAPHGFVEVLGGGGGVEDAVEGPRCRVAWQGDALVVGLLDGPVLRHALPHAFLRVADLALVHRSHARAHNDLVHGGWVGRWEWKEEENDAHKHTTRPAWEDDKKKERERWEWNV
jgi:hypothetical protein